jgi:hypothetical protein
MNVEQEFKRGLRERERDSEGGERKKDGEREQHLLT